MRGLKLRKSKCKLYVFFRFGWSCSVPIFRSQLAIWKFSIFEQLFHDGENPYSRVFSECVFVVVWSNGFIALPAQNQLCTLKSEVRFPCIGWSDVRMDESRCPGELKPHFDPCYCPKGYCVRDLHGGIR